MRRREFLYASALARSSLAQVTAQSTEPEARELPATFRIQRGRFRFGSPLKSGPAVEGARLGLDVNGTTLWSDKASGANWNGAPSGEIQNEQPARLELHFDNPQLVWTIEFQAAADGTSATIASHIRNASGSPVKLGRCRLADTSDGSGSIRIGSGAKDTVLLAMTGWQEDSRTRVIRSDPKGGLSKIVAQLYNPASTVAIQFGFVTLDRVNTEHHFSWNSDKNVLSGSSFCDFEGFSLAPGASVESEKLLLQINRDPHKSLNSWADAVNAKYHPSIWPKIPAGWIGVSWVDPLDIERWDEVLHRNIGAIRERLPGMDIQYVWVSFGNLEGLEPGNWLAWNKDEFPAGHEALVRELASRDFQLGFWIAPFWLNAHLSKLVDELHDAFLLRERKPVILHLSEWGDFYVLDPTHPKTQAYLKRVFTTYREWGVRYYMIDFLNATSGLTLGNVTIDGYYDKSVMPGPQAFREGVRVIREAAGSDTYLLASTGPTLQYIGLVDAARMGHDYGEGRTLYGGRTPYGPSPGVFYPATFGINDPRLWTSHIHATNALAASSFLQRKFFLADSGNLLTIDKPIPLPDAQITATIFGINGSPAMLGDDIDRMSEERLQILKQVFPRLPEAAYAVDLFETPEPDYPKIFHLPVSTRWGRWDLVAIFNYGDSQLKQDLRFERLGIDSHAQIVWDFWEERYLGIRSGGLAVDVLPRSVRLLRISQQREHPWLLSTDMHVRQGQAEIEDVQWNSGSSTLMFRATRPKGYRGNVYLRIRKGLAFKDPAGLWIAKDVNEGCLIVRCALNFESDTAIEKSFVLVPEASLISKPPAHM